MQMSTLKNAWQRDWQKNIKKNQRKPFIRLRATTKPKKQAKPGTPENKENVEPEKAGTKRKRGKRSEEVIAMRIKVRAEKAKSKEEKAQKKNMKRT